MINETKPPRRVLRSVGAVLAGVTVIVALSIGTDVALRAMGIYPPSDERMSDGLFVLATAYRIVYSALGSYVAARLAPGRPMGHALAIGVIGLVVSLAGAIATRNAGPELGPKWYPIAIVVIALPCAWAGGKFREMQLRSGAGRRA